MMVQTKGLVLHRVKYGDTGLIVKVFTEKYGNISFFIQNSFSRKSKFPNALFSPLSLLDIHFEYKKNNQLYYFKEVSAYYHYRTIPFDIIKSSIFMFYNELIYKLLFDAVCDELLYDFLEHKLIGLDEVGQTRPDVHLIFLYELSQVLGFAPEDNYLAEFCVFPIENSQIEMVDSESAIFLSKEAGFYLQQIIKHYQQPEEIELPSKRIRSELLQGLIKYYRIHNEHIKSIDSIEVLSEVLG